MKRGVCIAIGAFFTLVGTAVLGAYLYPTFAIGALRRENVELLRRRERAAERAGRIFRRLVEANRDGADPARLDRLRAWQDALRETRIEMQERIAANRQRTEELAGESWWRRWVWASTP